MWDCNLETGEVRWRRKVARCVRLGCLVGASDDGRGYLKARYKGQNYYLHRVIWAAAHGQWPQKLIDHINRNRSDNRLRNLREVGVSFNLVNKLPRAASVSGLKGVAYDKRDGRYYAYIDYDGGRQALGGFETAEEAFRARCEAEVSIYGDVVSWL